MKTKEDSGSENLWYWVRDPGTKSMTLARITTLRKDNSPGFKQFVMTTKDGKTVKAGCIWFKADYCQYGSGGSKVPTDYQEPAYPTLPSNTSTSSASNRSPRKVPKEPMKLAGDLITHGKPIYQAIWRKKVYTVSVIEIKDGKYEVCAVGSRKVWFVDKLYDLPDTGKPKRGRPPKKRKATSSPSKTIEKYTNNSPDTCKPKRGRPRKATSSCSKRTEKDSDLVNSLEMVLKEDFEDANNSPDTCKPKRDRPEKATSSCSKQTEKDSDSVNSLEMVLEEDFEDANNSPDTCKPKRGRPQKATSSCSKRTEKDSDSVNSLEMVLKEDFEDANNSPDTCKPKHGRPQKANSSCSKQTEKDNDLVNNNLEVVLEEDLEDTNNSPDTCKPKHGRPQKANSSCSKQTEKDNDLVNNNLEVVLEEDLEDTNNSPDTCKPKRGRPQKANSSCSKQTEKDNDLVNNLEVDVLHGTSAANKIPSPRKCGIKRKQTPPHSSPVNNSPTRSSITPPQSNKHPDLIIRNEDGEKFRCVYLPEVNAKVSRKKKRQRTKTGRFDSPDNMSLHSYLGTNFPELGMICRTCTSLYYSRDAICSHIRRSSKNTKCKLYSIVECVDSESDTEGE